MRTISIDSNKVSESSSTFVDSWARKLVLNWLSTLKEGRLTIVEDKQSLYFGQSEKEATTTGSIIINHASTYRDILFTGAIGAAEAYMKGSWSSPNLVHVIQVLCQNMDLVMRLNSRWSTLNTMLMSCSHRLFRANSKKNSKLNIAAH